MNSVIDTNFDVESDTPKGKDPDQHSPTLRKFHRILWSKELPSGDLFDLNESIPLKLHHKSVLGEFILSSDGIGNTYTHRKSMNQIIIQFPKDEIRLFYYKCSTIGSFIIFPCNRIDNNMTMNQSRGMNRSIGDRFDLTLECIKRYYTGENNPLNETLLLYSNYFRLFQDFEGFVNFFLLQDLVSKDYSKVRFLLPFDNFNSNPVPQEFDEYKLFKNNLINFIDSRNKRINRWTEEN